VKTRRAEAGQAHHKFFTVSLSPDFSPEYNTKFTVIIEISKYTAILGLETWIAGLQNKNT